VAARPGGPPVTLRAGDVRIESIDAAFAAWRVDDTARVEVTRGSIQLWQDGRRVQLDAGGSWSGMSIPPAVEPAPDASRDRPGASGGVGAGGGAPPRGPSAADDKATYERAARAEATDPALALSLYEALARRPGPWAANALFAQARLEIDLGRRDRGARLLHTYLHRYPRGLNASDARALLDGAAAR
jgi:hypothetical protein